MSTLSQQDEIDTLRGSLSFVESQLDEARTKLSVAAEVVGEVRGVCKAGDDELTVLAVRRALRERDDEIKALRRVVGYESTPSVWVGETRPDPQMLADALRAEKSK